MKARVERLLQIGSVVAIYKSPLSKFSYYGVIVTADNIVIVLAILNYGHTRVLCRCIFISLVGVYFRT